ncbi:MAG: hypothetical protein RMJ98_21230 [Myxococcales bacterium]|nr:hypothetical protein [Polyangiaceae bacterium]MDW8251828.1 hypothetical protein [Myxococcales bacterium]
MALAKSSPPPSKKQAFESGLASKKTGTPAKEQASVQAPMKASPRAVQQQILKNLVLRLGLPLLAGWMFAAFFHAWWAYTLVGVLTVAAAGVVYWGWRRTERSLQVADILQSVDPTSKEGRKEALEKLAASGLDKNDTVATLARAQLTMQDDPDKALAELETIDLGKILLAEADQVRFQKALILLTRGELDRARALVDLIDLSRHQDKKARAVMAGVIAEAWGRTGQAKKALELLDLYKVDDAEYAEIRPQLLKARAFSAASLNDMKEVRRVLRQMSSDNPQYLGVFLQKKVHPLLRQEAKTILMKSGAVPRPKPQYRYR